MTDFTVLDSGSIFILTAKTPEAIAWVAEHIPADASRWGRNGIVVEHRYIDDIVAGFEEDGLTVRST